MQGKDEFEDALLELLPSDGTPVLNRVMRVMMSKRIGRIIDANAYVEARDHLQQLGRIGVTRGQGGKVFLIAQPEPAETTITPETWSEAALMPFLGNYLSEAFQDELDLPNGSTVVVQDVSRVGPREGQWTRPDFLLVSLARLMFMPQQQLDVHTFELKAEYGGSVQSVHEALAQTRFSHFGHLVWHLPEGSPTEARLDEIEGQCARHGIGLILMRDPVAARFEVRLGPVRHHTAALDIDGFLVSRLSTDNQQVLKAALRLGSAL